MVDQILLHFPLSSERLLPGHRTGEAEVSCG